MRFTDILFILLIIFIAGYGVFYYFRTQRLNEIRELDQRKEDMMNVSIADQLFTLKNMELSGQTKRKYESLVATWTTITNFKFTEIETALVGAEQFTEQMNLHRAKKAIDSVRELLDETEIQVDELSEEIDKLMDIIMNNQEHHEVQLERYNEARKSIMNHAFEYGPAIETLEKNLQNIELNFTKYNELTSEGDHIEADDMLTTIEAELDTMEDILERIPKMYEKIKNEYEDSLDDLLDGYNKMKDSHYNFAEEDIPEQVEEVGKHLEEAKNSIKNADLMEAQTLMDRADRNIQSLYDYMEGEIESREYVNTHINQLKLRIEEVSDHNRYTGIEVDRLSQSYILHENEEEQIRNLKSQIQNVIQRVDEAVKKIQSQEAVYSVIESELKRIYKRIDEINDKQLHIVENLSELNKREKEAKSNLDLFELDLRNMKRRLEKQHLPGLSQNYYDLFYKVTEQIEVMSQMLNRVKIDMNDIEELQDELEQNLQKLEDMTDTIIDSATLTEYMIQHSNRFRFEYPEINDAIQEAEYLFNTQYSYEESLAVIERELRRVDQDGPTQVRRMYHQEKQNRYY